MLSVLIIFFTTCLISIIGSLQLGPVNLYVINTVLFVNKKSAFFIAIGGCVPEFIYCTLAVYANIYLQESSVFNTYFKIIFIIILISIGFVFLFKKIDQKKAEIQNNDVKRTSNLKYFIKGFSLAILNPQLLPFWIFVQVYYNTINILIIKSNLQKIAFILGTGIGAFILLVSLLVIVNKHKGKILHYINNKYYYKAISILFFTLALYQLIILI